VCVCVCVSVFNHIKRDESNVIFGDGAYILWFRFQRGRKALAVHETVRTTEQKKNF